MLTQQVLNKCKTQQSLHPTVQQSGSGLQHEAHSSTARVTDLRHVAPAGGGCHPLQQGFEGTVATKHTCKQANKQASEQASEQASGLHILRMQRGRNVGNQWQSTVTTYHSPSCLWSHSTLGTARHARHPAAQRTLPAPSYTREDDLPLGIG